MIPQFEAGKKWMVKHREQERIIMCEDAKAAASFFVRAREMAISL